MFETTWDAVAALSPARRHLFEAAPREAMLGVVRDLVAVQAQVMSSAELALRARIGGLARADVRRAGDEGGAHAGRGRGGPHRRLPGPGRAVDPAIVDPA